MKAPSKIIICCQLLLLSLLFNHVPAHAENMRNIERKGEFEIGVNPRAMPLSDLIEQQEGRQPGIQIDIGKELAKRLKVELKISWLSFRYQAKYTTCDAFLGVGRIKGEPENPYLKKTIPFFKVEMLLVTGPEIKLQGWDDIKGKRIAVDNGSIVHDTLKDKDVEIFVSYTSAEKKLKAIEDGEIDIALVSNLGLGWYLKNNSDFKYQTASSSLVTDKYEYDYAFGLRRADFMTVRDFNDLITAMIEDGTLQSIFESYGVQYEVKKWQGEFIR